MLSLLLLCHLLLPALRGSNRARVVWQWSYQILRLHKMAGESHQMEVLAFPNPGWEQHRRCSWCFTPTARWCDRCESSFLCQVTMQYAWLSSLQLSLPTHVGQYVPHMFCRTAQAVTRETRRNLQKRAGAMAPCFYGGCLLRCATRVKLCC